LLDSIFGGILHLIFTKAESIKIILVMAGLAQHSKGFMMNGI
jgi:hypothetical protein